MRSAQHLPEAVRPLGAQILEPLPELPEEALRHLLAEPQHQLLELLPRFRIDELVVLEPADGSAQILRQRVQRGTPLRSDALDLLPLALGPRLAARGRLPRGVDAPVDPLPLGVEDISEPLTEIPEDVTEVVPVEQPLALAAQPREEIPQARHLLPVARAEALPKEPLERAPRVSVGDQVISHRREEVVRVEIRERLGTIPAGVAAPHALYRGPPAPRSLLSFRFRWRPSSTNSTAAAMRAGWSAAPSRSIAAPKPAARPT